jgi:type I restriction enzyme S subunit
LRLYPEVFFNICLLVPPLQEQATIVKTLDAELSEARELEASLKKSVELLSERQTALMTAAVTGQIDVVEA